MSLLFLSPLKKIVSSSAWTPASSSSLKLWYDMNNTSKMTFASSNNIQTISDLSPSGITATWYSAGGTNAQQVSNQLNGLAVLHTNQTSAYSFSAAPYDLATSSGWSKYFIMRINTASQNHAWFYTHTDTNNVTATPVRTSYFANDNTYGLAFLQENGAGAIKAPKITDTTSFHVVEFHYTGGGNSSSANYAINLDHVAQTLTTGAGDWVNGNGMTGYDGSNDPVNWLHCDVAAIIDFSPTLDTTTRGKMTTWINNTYGL